MREEGGWPTAQFRKTEKSAHDIHVHSTVQNEMFAKQVISINVAVAHGTVAATVARYSVIRWLYLNEVFGVWNKDIAGWRSAARSLNGSFRQCGRYFCSSCSFFSVCILLEAYALHHSVL